ncbi:CYCD3-1 [Linum perenne]
MRITALTSSIRLITPSDRLSFHDDDDDEELCSLFDKERGVELKTAARNPVARRRAVEWIVKVNNHYEFSTLTAFLAINYLDRFIAGPCNEKPWTIQLVAVGCLSLAAKVEETDVPLLLDLQIDRTRYLFEAKTIQRVELLILSELGWRMHPVTPISFMDHIVERMRLKGNAHWDFLSRCHRLLLCLLSGKKGGKKGFLVFILFSNFVHMLRKKDFVAFSRCKICQIPSISSGNCNSDARY